MKITIDEAIQHAEEVAEENERFCQAMPEHSASAFHCAEEHRQLAEWLKELQQCKKALEEIKEIININNNYIQEDVLKYKMICAVLGESDERN